ncbi:Multi antimicrobial extrusion protein (Na(+)/drug antiporter), MATE family of MDR efflux pumps, partial [hydrothermal vent metagenome]
MSFIKRKKSLSTSLVSVLMILTVSLFLFSCAKDNSYDTSKEIAAERPEYTAPVTISSVKLKSWLDNGYPGAPNYGLTKMVILFVGTQD